MALSVRKRWLAIFGTIISILSSLLTSYVQRDPFMNPVEAIVDVFDDTDR